MIRVFQIVKHKLVADIGDAHTHTHINVNEVTSKQQRKQEYNG